MTTVGDVHDDLDNVTLSPLPPVPDSVFLLKKDVVCFGVLINFR